MLFLEKVDKFFHLILGLKLQKWLLDEKIDFILNLPDLRSCQNLLDVSLVNIS